MRLAPTQRLRVGQADEVDHIAVGMESEDADLRQGDAGASGRQLVRRGGEPADVAILRGACARPEVPQRYRRRDRLGGREGHAEAVRRGRGGPEQPVDSRQQQRKREGGIVPGRDQRPGPDEIKTDPRHVDDRRQHPVVGPAFDAQAGEGKDRQSRPSDEDQRELHKGRWPGAHGLAQEHRLRRGRLRRRISGQKVGRQRQDEYGRAEPHHES